jgi:hypothetical protein
MDRSFWGPYDPKWHELFAILCVSSKIIMQIPLRNWIKNEAVQSRLYWPDALTRTNRENKNVKCNILYVLFSCCFCIKSNARISLNIGDGHVHIYTAIWPSVPWTICSYHFAYSPIWGYFNTLTARFRNESIPLDTVYSKIECEKLHIKFCKRVLGVHQKSTIHTKMVSSKEKVF